ncbi:MAG: lipoyl(octanoyl) transferase LipB [Deltaproteobacteria bacterium]|nr:lipoyl(octanoyl) transferase LipB [Deltaproteobacteria bacterium]
MASRPLHVHRLGRVAYGEALGLQERVQAARVAGEIPDTLLLVEHPPVVTLGRGARDDGHLRVPREVFAARGFELHEVGRGGDVTYHGPGQVVAYPILDLKPDRQDVRRYVWTLEEAMIRVAAGYGVRAGRVEGLNGTWVGDNKLGAVGVRISRWVTMHGLAFNVTTDLSHFDLIVPCGIQGKGVTSLARETGRDVPRVDVEDALVRELSDIWQATPEEREGAPAV